MPGKFKCNSCMAEFEAEPLLNHILRVHPESTLAKMWRRQINQAQSEAMRKAKTNIANQIERQWTLK